MKELIRDLKALGIGYSLAQEFDYCPDDQSIAEEYYGEIPNWENVERLCSGCRPDEIAIKVMRAIRKLETP